ncbi:MAG: DNA-3-methyladenine glycosylase 2 family protein [Gammaproteobacteria bacterium]|nr:DNA-3-methyladenine glycosylase 2 family protein [Gammaproteobacteria bacterium]
MKAGAAIAMAASSSFDVELPGPLDLPASLERFRSAGDDGVDRWDGTHLVRTERIGDRAVAYVATVAGTVDQPTLRVTVADPFNARAVEHAVRSTFTRAPTAFAELVLTDPVIARLDARYRGLRQVQHPDLLAAFARCVSAQQVNLRWAAITRRRLAETFGDRHSINGHEVYSLNASRLAGATVAEIRALQFTTRKAEYIIGIAEAIANQRVRLADLIVLPDDEVIARLTALRGIGVWTAEWILARTLGRPRVVAGDLGVRKAVGQAYGSSATPSEADVRRITAHWGASASVAQTLLLHALHENVLGMND